MTDHSLPINSFLEEEEFIIRGRGNSIEKSRRYNFCEQSNRLTESD